MITYLHLKCSTRTHISTVPAMFWDYLYVWLLWFERSKILHTLTILSDIDISKITWRSIRSRSRGLKPLSPLCSSTNTKRWGFRTMKLCANLNLFSNLTILLVSSRSWVLICCNSWSEEPVCRRWPFLSFWAYPLRTMLKLSSLIHWNC